MSKSKQLLENEFFDQMMLDEESFGHKDDIISTFGQVAEALGKHIKVAYVLVQVV